MKTNNTAYVELTLTSKLLKKNYLIKAKEGSILMDVINNENIKDIAVFGICNKQLACHSCSVKILYKNEICNELNKISEEEQDVTDEIKKENIRMSCQIKLSKELNGMIVEVNDASFLNS